MTKVHQGNGIIIIQSDSVTRRHTTDKDIKTIDNLAPTSNTSTMRKLTTFQFERFRCGRFQ